MSLANTVWAMEQKCATPLQKLLLIELSELADEDGFWRGAPAKLVDACCTTEADLAEAVLDLDEIGKLKLLSAQDGVLDIAFPWWKPEPVRKYIRQDESDPSIVRYTRKGLWEEQGGCCWYCGCDIHADPQAEPYAQIEHQHPRSRGGRSSKENIVLACRPCNIRKKAKTVDEFRAWLEARDGAPVRFHGETSQ